MNTDTVNHIHFIGIGGIGMSALARLFVHDKKKVTGTNDSESPATLDDLRRQGVEISLNQSVLPEADLYVFSEAWRSLNPEILKKAESTGKPVINYFEALGTVVNDYYLIAVAGSHGKTTTTAMLIDVFETVGKDPTGIVGSLRAKTKSNFRPGKSKYAIVEACEYKRDFLSLRPDVLVILNLEHEHVDYYKDLEAVQDAFREFVGQVKEGGVVVTDCSNQNIKPVIQDSPVEVVDYKEYIDPLLELKQPGMHNIKNAAAVFAVAKHEEIEKGDAQQALQNFAGTWRRFEYKGECNGAPVYDDYGHHPTEINATVQGAKDKYPGKDIIVVFQPHTYSRTQELFGDFVQELSKVDMALLLPIYAARKEEGYQVSSDQLVEGVTARGTKAILCEDFDEAVKKIREVANQDSVVLIMGAGDVAEVSTMLIG